MKRCELKLLGSGMLLLMVMVAFTVIVPAPSFVDDPTWSHQEGWPITLELQSTYSSMIYDSVVVDLEGDGNLDIIASYSLSKTESYIDAYELDGSQKTDSNFPILILGDIDSEVSAGDLNQDGKLEIVVNARTYDGSDYHAATYVFEHDGEGYVELWHFEESMKCGAIHTPTLGDIDGDGDLEIIAASHRYDNGWKGIVYAWHHNGTQVSGWPVTNNHWGPFISPALGDIDNDDKLEVITGSWDGYVYAWNDDGSPVTGNWPVFIGEVITYQPPQIGDLDDDDNLEIVQISNNNGNIYIIDGQGNIIRTIQPDPDKKGIGQTPGLCDIDNDNDLEIFVNIEDYIYGWHHDGTLVDGSWPIQIGEQQAVKSSIILGDVDNDYYPDVIFIPTYVLNGSAGIFAFHTDGTLIDGWPYSLADVNNIYSSGTLIDVDKDEDIEIVFTYAYLQLPGMSGSSFFTIDILDLDEDMNVQTLQWPMFQHNELHTGLYIAVFTADAHGPYEAEVGEDIQFMGSVTDGVEPYTYHWNFGNGDTSDDQSPKYNYSAVGIYTVNLTVIDNASNFAYDETTATIIEPPPDSNLSIKSITGGFGVTVVIENQGDANVTDAEYEIHVEGGILGLINKTVNGTIDIKVNESKDVTTGIFFGLGGIDITVTVADKEKTAEGIQVIIFTLI